MSAYNLLFELNAVQNVLMIIRRDMAAKLSELFPTDNLADFKEYTFGTANWLNYPLVNIDPVSSPAVQSADDSRVTSPLRISVILCVTAADQNAVCIKIMKYVAALDSVLRNVKKSDYVLNTTGVFGLVIEIGHQYGPVGKHKEAPIYARPAQLDLVINYSQARG